MILLKFLWLLLVVFAKAKMSFRASQSKSLIASDEPTRSDESSHQSVFYISHNELLVGDISNYHFQLKNKEALTVSNFNDGSKFKNFVVKSKIQFGEVRVHIVDDKDVPKEYISFKGTTMDYVFVDMEFEGEYKTVITCKEENANTSDGCSLSIYVEADSECYLNLVKSDCLKNTHCGWASGVPIYGSSETFDECFPTEVDASITNAQTFQTNTEDNSGNSGNKKQFLLIFGVVDLIFLNALLVCYVYGCCKNKKKESNRNNSFDYGRLSDCSSKDYGSLLEYSSKMKTSCSKSPSRKSNEAFPIRDFSPEISDPKRLSIIDSLNDL
eukprot:TRINITY_DN4389_c0_g1_i1.p1 TRINITY_DN4389_c0_g1~~TRINITY_DN4389_c0_g1_i1.p1  ORF type:complete len:327 (-),score=56.67 TRINITY_DN4389_c0_g1_i1:338-1318(-)